MAFGHLMGQASGGRPVFELEEDREVAKTKVIGLGGGGSNAVNRMLEAQFPGVEFVVANTDAQALRASRAPVRLQIGARLTAGLGAGADPDVGRNAAQEDREQLKQVLEGADMVFVTPGSAAARVRGRLRWWRRSPRSWASSRWRW